jgi:hypothetical protein
MVWLCRSPIPVGRKGVFYLFKLFLPALRGAWRKRGEGQHPVDQDPTNPKHWLYKSITINYAKNQGCGSGIRCRDPGWLKCQIRIRDEQPGSYFRKLRNHFLGLKYLHSLMRIRDPALKKFGSGMEKIRIRDKHPGSALLQKISYYMMSFSLLNFYVTFSISGSCQHCGKSVRQLRHLGCGPALCRESGRRKADRKSDGYGVRSSKAGQG